MRLLLALPLTLMACSQAPEEAGRAIPRGPEPTVPSASPSATGEIAWLAELPQVSLRAKAGEQVWATVPQANGLAEAGLFTVDTVGSGHAGLVDRTGKRHKRVPAALVHAIGDGRRLRVGDVALVHLWALPATIARVSQMKAGRVTHVHYDWLGRSKEGAVEHAEPPPSGIAPLGYVGYKKLGKLSKGLVVALDGARAFVLTSSGHVEAHATSALVPIDLRTYDYQLGQQVSAYRWATGYLHGKVTQVLEPGLRYRVAFPDDPPAGEDNYFFTELSPQRYR